MTNFEWIKNDDEILEDLLIHCIAVDEKTGEVRRCTGFPCIFCSFFNKEKDCDALREEWLKKEHESQYKRGDIILIGSGYLRFVISETEPGTLMTANNLIDLNNGIGSHISTKCVERKVGNVFESEEDEV